MDEPVVRPVGDTQECRRGKRDRLQIVDAKQSGAQAVVDIVGVIGDVVSNAGNLRFKRRMAPQLQIEARVELGDSDR